MKTFGWVCFWLGVAILAIGLPAVLIFGMTPMLIGKVLVAAVVNISIGWNLAHPKAKKVYMQKYCISCGSPVEANKFCTNCGMQRCI